MKRPLIAGNWKMNLARAEAVQLARGVAARAGEAAGADLVVCPPSVYLVPAGEVLAGTTVRLGAQNMYHEPAGAFTGEISPAMLRDVGCEFVILGHSERRHLLGESDAQVAVKTTAALQHGLTPIVCVGETLDQREAGETAEVIQRQYTGSLGELAADQLRSVVIAYEPVWAIGTGRSASPEQAEEVHADLRRIMRDRYNDQVAEQIRILYGGSVKPQTAPELCQQSNIDGFLVGGASLDADSFIQIAVAASG